MQHRKVVFLLVLCLTAWAARVEAARPAPTCPPPGFDSVPRFKLNRYIAAPWFIQQQRPLPRQGQPIEELFCVRAAYKYFTPGNPQDGLAVFNYVNRGINGQENTGLAGGLRALLAEPNGTSPTSASKLLVGPQRLVETLPEAVVRSTFGQYWVVAVGSSANKTIGYDWAIISGGPPTLPANSEGCKCTLTELNGLWLFTRQPVASKKLIKKMRKVAQGLGFDVSILVDVGQDGCRYDGAVSEP